MNSDFCMLRATSQITNSFKVQLFKERLALIVKFYSDNSNCLNYRKRRLYLNKDV